MRSAMLGSILYVDIQGQTNCDTENHLGGEKCTDHQSKRDKSAKQQQAFFEREREPVDRYRVCGSWVGGSWVGRSRSIKSHFTERRNRRNDFFFIVAGDRPRVLRVPRVAVGLHATLRHRSVAVRAGCVRVACIAPLSSSLVQRSFYKIE